MDSGTNGGKAYISPAYFRLWSEQQKSDLLEGRQNPVSL